MIGLELALVAALLSDDRPYEQWDVPCPDRARGVVTYEGGAAGMDWTATPQSSSVQSASIETMGGNQVLVCHYQMFGQDYWIWMRPPLQVPYCVVGDPAGRAMFICNNGGRRS